MTRDGAERSSISAAAPANDIAARRLSFAASPIACAIALALAIGPMLRTPLGVDVAWILFVSRRWLDGAHPYVDIIDYKPPLVFLLAMPLDTLARVTGWPADRVIAFACLGLAAVSIVLLHRLLRRSRTRGEGLIATTLAGSVLAMLATQARDLGQVDHVMLIAFLPYVVLCALDSIDDGGAVSRALRVGVGLLAAAGVALKPPFVIAWLVLLAFVAISRRSRRSLRAPEHVTVAASLLVYAIVVAVTMPVYLQRIVPMAYVHHWLHGDPFIDLAGDWMVVAVVAGSLGLAIAARWLTRDREWSSLVRACAWASLGLFVTYLAQRQAVPEFFLGVRAFNFLAVWIAIAGFVAGHVKLSAAGQRTTPAAWLAFAGRIAVLALVIMPVIVVGSLVREVQQLDVANVQQGIRSPFAEPLIDVVRERAAGKPIFVLSTTVGPAFPLVNLTGATWPYRVSDVGFVSGYYQDRDQPVTAIYRPPEQQSPAERAFFDAVIEDLTRTPPALLIVDRARLKSGFGWAYFDYFSYYGQSSAFRALLRHYRPIGAKRTYQVFEYQPDPIEAP